MGTNAISDQCAWFIVTMAMCVANAGAIPRAEAEHLMDKYFDRCEQERRRMFPETEEAK